MIKIKLNHTWTKFQFTCLSDIPLHKNSNILHWLHQSSVQISTAQARYWRTSPQTKPESRTTPTKELQLCAVAMDTARLSSTTLQWQKDNEHSNFVLCTKLLGWLVCMHFSTSEYKETLIYSQTGVQRSPLRNCKVTIIYRVTALSRSTLQKI